MSCVGFYDAQALDKLCAVRMKQPGPRLSHRPVAAGMTGDCMVISSKAAQVKDL